MTLVLSSTQILLGSSQFPHRFESEDHARPWFCLALSFFLEVASFPIGLSPRTMQDLGSVQCLDIFFRSNQFPHRFESEDHARHWFCLVLSFFFFRSSQFPHRFESDDHTRSWFCLALSFFFLEVASFPISLSSMTIQDLGSVQHLVFFFFFFLKQLVSPQV